MGCVCEGWSACKNNTFYHLLVPLSPSPGHTFHWKLGTVGEMLARNSCLRVQLKCTCMREQLVRNMLCFLHHCQDELRRNQESSLPHTLCSGSYLNVEKTSLWFQVLVKAAWQVMSQSQHCWLMVLSSSRSCKLQLTNASKGTLSIEMRF